jgi:hypothetical protein
VHGAVARVLAAEPARTTSSGSGGGSSPSLGGFAASQRRPHTTTAAGSARAERSLLGAAKHAGDSAVSAAAGGHGHGHGHAAGSSSSTSAGGGAAPNTPTSCAVCLSEYEPGDTVAVLPCSPLHAFHKGCVVPWLKTQKRCPLCTLDIDEVGAAGSGGSVPHHHQHHRHDHDD